MSTNVEIQARIDQIDQVNRGIVLNGNPFQVGAKVNLQYYKVGDVVTAKATSISSAPPYGVVVFIQKHTEAQQSPMPAFTPSNTIPYAQPQQSVSPFAPVMQNQAAPQKSSGKDTIMLWCNSVNSAIEIIRIRSDHMTATEISETDLIDLVIKDASRLFSAGASHDRNRSYDN